MGFLKKIKANHYLNITGILVLIINIYQIPLEYKLIQLFFIQYNISVINLILICIVYISSLWSNRGVYINPIKDMWIDIRFYNYYVIKTNVRWLKGNHFIIHSGPMVLLNYQEDNDYSFEEFDFIINHEYGHVISNHNIWYDLESFLLLALNNLTIINLFLFKNLGINLYLLLFNVFVLYFINKIGEEERKIKELKQELYCDEYSQKRSIDNKVGILYLINYIYTILGIKEWSLFKDKDLNSLEFNEALEYLKDLSKNNDSLKDIYIRVVNMLRKIKEQ